MRSAPSWKCPQSCPGNISNDGLVEHKSFITLAGGVLAASFTALLFSSSDQCCDGLIGDATEGSDAEDDDLCVCSYRGESDDNSDEGSGWEVNEAENDSEVKSDNEKN